jgi:electron transfer flavoprotein alpha subunit
MVLAFAEHDGDVVHEASLQALALARRLAGGDPVTALVAGAPADAVVAALGEHGAGTVLVAEGDGFADGFAPAAWGRAIAQAAAERGVATVLAAGSDRGNEVMAHAAAIADAPLAANCVDAAAGDPLAVTRMRWGGSVLEEARVHGALKLLTVAPHAVAAEAAPAGAPAVERFAPALQDADLVARVVERVDTSSGGISLADAPVVVSGGRGVGGEEGFAPLEDLAGLLGGVVGCSRAVTIAGWRPHTDQVGQTGTKIAPDLYIAAGISGATQHMAGCKGAKKVLAINADPEAAILASADFAVIGDLAEVVPAIAAEIRRVRGG